MDFDKKRILGFFVYSVAWITIMSAGWMALSGLDARRQEGQSMHAALQMNAMQTMERMEYNDISEQAEYAYSELNHLRQQAEGFVNKVHWEQEQAQQDAVRAQSFQKVATNDQQEANWIANQVNATEHDRVVLLQTIHDEKQAEKQMLQQLRDADFRSGLCETRGLSYLCELIGGITQLQKEADETDLQIHRDMERLQAMYQQEYLQIITYQAFQHEADKYQRVADDLVHTASLWGAQADQDQIKAEALVQDAESVEKQAVALEKQSHLYAHSTWEMTNAVNDMLRDAHRYEKTSVTAFCISLVLLVLPLVVFTFRCMAGFVNVFNQMTTWSRRNQHSVKELCRGISHVVLHVLFFLATTVTCREYLANLDHYSTRKRFVVILYVAFLGSLAQSLSLQAIPHLVFEQPWGTSRNVTAQITWDIVKMFIMRLILLLPCFALEFLFLWLSPFCQTVVDPNEQMLYFVYFSLTLGLAMYFLYLEPRQAPELVHFLHEDHSTVNQDDSDDEEESVKEDTPLKSGDHGSTVTELFPELFVVRTVDPNELDSSHHYSLDASSPFYVDFQDGLRQIFFLLETFVLFSGVVILNLNLELLIPAYVKAVRIILGCLVVGMYLVLACGGRRQTESEFSAKVIDL